MSLQANTNISVDFHDNKYIMVNAKQLDSGSRLVAVTCYNQGNIMNLTANKHTAYVRCRKADGYRVFNNCRINYKGEVLVELTNLESHLNNENYGCGTKLDVISWLVCNLK